MAPSASLCSRNASTPPALLPNDLETVVATALSKENLMVDPVVSVSVIEYRSRPISVAGAVRHPLTFQASGELTLLDAISRAEGLAENAGPEILISRRQPVSLDGKSVTLVQRVAVARLIDGADADVNLALVGGEEIRVPEAGRVYVVGNVKKPGAFPIKDGAETSLLKASPSRKDSCPTQPTWPTSIARKAPPEARTKIPIELKKIIERKIAGRSPPG